MADNALYVAVKPTRLAAGTSAGATSMTVGAIQDRLGNTLTMADFGSKGYGVISPGKDKEEQFVFTGISGNTVSGISWVTMKSPYTETSGFNEAHAAGETIVLYTNSPAFFNSFLNKNNDETVAGTYTFTEGAMPRLSAAHSYGAGDEEYLATYRAVQNASYGGTVDASTTAKGIFEEATQAEIAAGTAAGSTAARLAVNPSTLAPHVQSGAWLFGSTAGTADALTATLTPTLTAYTHGMQFTLHITTANNAGCTLNVDGLGAKAVYKYAGGTAVAVEANDMKALYHHLFVYDSDADVFLLVNPVGGDLTAAIRSEVETVFAATDITGAELETLSNGSNADTKHYHRQDAADASLFATGVIHLPLRLDDDNVVVSGNNVGGNEIWKLPATWYVSTGNNSASWDAIRTDGTGAVASGTGEDGLFFGTSGETGDINMGTVWTAVIRLRLSTLPATTDTFFIGFAENADTLDASGASPTTSRHMGLEYQPSGTTWRTSTGDNTTQETNNISTPSAGWHEFKIVRSASSVVFYLDGTLLAIHSTNIPTSGDVIFYHGFTNGAAGTRKYEIHRTIDFYAATT